MVDVFGFLMSTDTLVLSGKVYDGEDQLIASGLTGTAKIGDFSVPASFEPDGRYSATFISFTGAAARTGDTVVVSVTDADGGKALKRAVLSVEQIVNKLAEEVDVNFILKGPKYIKTATWTISRTVDLAYVAGGGSVEIYSNNQLAGRAGVDGVSGRFTSEVPLSEGHNNVTIVTIDSLSRRATPFVPREVVVDTQAPIIDAVQPGDGAKVAQLDTVRAVLQDSTIVANNVSGLDPDSIQVTLDDVPVAIDDPATEQVDGYQFSSISGELVVPVSATLV